MKKYRVSKIRMSDASNLAVFNACLAIGESHLPEPRARDEHSVALRRVIAHTLALHKSSPEIASGLGLKTHTCILKYWTQTSAKRPCSCGFCKPCLIRQAYHAQRRGFDVTVGICGHALIELDRELCSRWMDETGGGLDRKGFLSGVHA